MFVFELEKKVCKLLIFFLLLNYGVELLTVACRLKRTDFFLFHVALILMD